LRFLNLSLSLESDYCFLLKLFYYKFSSFIRFEFKILLNKYKCWINLINLCWYLINVRKWSRNVCRDVQHANAVAGTLLPLYVSPPALLHSKCKPRQKKSCRGSAPAKTTSQVDVWHRSNISAFICVKCRRAWIHKFKMNLDGRCVAKLLILLSYKQARRQDPYKWITC